MDKYQEENHPKRKQLKIGNCYLCDQPLSGEIDEDHIIPDHFFRESDGNRPQLPTHHKCNNGKSADDKFAVLEINFLSQQNHDARRQILDFLDLAQSEVPNAYLVGKRSKVKNLVLAKTLFGDIQTSFDIPINGEILTSFRNPAENARRIGAYMKRLTKGLYIRNMPEANPGLPRIRWIMYTRAQVHGDYDRVLGSISNIVSKSGADRFSQYWPGRVLYYGCHVNGDFNKGYIFIEFYEELGVLAIFNPDLEL